MNESLIIITGASSGIGAAVAKIFSEEELAKNVCICDIVIAPTYYEA